MLTGVIDGPVHGNPKAVELFSFCDVSDLSQYSIGSANNGLQGGVAEYKFPASITVKKGKFLYVTNNKAGFRSYFGFDADYESRSALAINGNDAIELFFGDTVVDTFGVVGEDGKGKSWEYTDGWCY